MRVFRFYTVGAQCVLFVDAPSEDKAPSQPMCALCCCVGIIQIRRLSMEGAQVSHLNDNVSCSRDIYGLTVLPCYDAASDMVT